MSRVAVVILCFNGIELTLECLESVRSSSHPDVDVMVVDNASTDGTARAVRAAYPDVHLIETGANLGYAEGNNVGLRAALARGADLAFLVNNDTTLAPDCIATLAETAARRPRAGILGPMVHTWDEGHIISSAGGMVDWDRADASNVGAGEVDTGQYPARDVDFVNGCGLMVTRAALETAGLLDPRFFMYWEETDWCQRIHKAGFDVRFEPAAHMRHKAPIHHRDLGPTTLYYVTRNRLLFFARHAPPARRVRALSRAVHGAVRGIVRHYRAGRPAHARATQWAVWHALTRRWGWADPALWQGVPAPGAARRLEGLGR
jgi:GT2 family glycosyltransferase